MNVLGFLVTLVAAVLFFQFKTEKRRVHLVSQWYWDRNFERRSELLQSVVCNAANEYVNEIHLLLHDRRCSSKDIDFVSHNNIECSASFVAEIIEHLKQVSQPLRCPPFSTILPKLNNIETRLRAKLKLISNSTNHERMTIAEGLYYANQLVRVPGKDIVILSNLDIVFDDTLKFLFTSGSRLSMLHFFFLSRYEVEESVSIGTQCGPKFIGSHDSIVLLPPIPTSIIEKCRYELGSWGIENRVMWEMQNYGINISNPCSQIKSWHNHKSQIKNKEMPAVNKEGKSAVAYPDS